MINSTRLQPLVVLAALGLAVTACSDRTPTSPAVTAVGVGAVAHAAAPTRWGEEGPGYTVVLEDGAGGDPTMTYKYEGPGAWTTQTWDFFTVSTFTANVTLGYSFSGFHAWHQVRAFVAPYIIHNGVKSYVSGGVSAGPTSFGGGPPSGGFAYSGSVTFAITPGDQYGFEFGGSNFDSDYRLQGTFSVVLPPDFSPPAITPVFAGTPGANGWYRSDVTVAWVVSDPESPVTSTTGCGPSYVLADTPGVSFTCSATSSGGTASNSATVKRDVTAPVITFSGNAVNYTVDQQVQIVCTATDVTSGIATANCPGVNAPGYEIALGSHTLSAYAEDKAGNGTVASTQYAVGVTASSLCALVERWVAKKGVANSLCGQLEKGQYGAFRNHVSSQSGKELTPTQAILLIRLTLWL